MKGSQEIDATSACHSIMPARAGVAVVVKGFLNSAMVGRLVEKFDETPVFSPKGGCFVSDFGGSYEREPLNIEEQSFDLIRKVLSSYAIDESLLDIVVRVVHAGADFSLANLIEAKNNAVIAARGALSRGGVIFCDVEMLRSGISRRECERLKLKPVSYIHDEDVARAAKEQGITRAMASVDKALKEGVRIFAFGNAPTALFRLLERIRAGAFVDFVCGMPVGFVGAADSKEELASSDIPSILLKGPRGGSGLCAACLNALLRMV
jgi:precorrin-8X/cobalt-precorrin-8 methylmutase